MASNLGRLTVGNWIAAAIALGVCTRPAPAGFMPDFSGHFRGIAEDNPQFESTTNFAVLDRTGNLPGDSWGTGLANFNSVPFGNGDARPLDVNAQYLYLYQVANDGVNENDETVTQFAAALQTEAFITSFGRWDLTLTDVNGDINTSNPFGPNSSSHQVSAPPQLGVVQPGLAQKQNLDQVGTNVTQNRFEVTLTLDASDPPSHVFGFTSNRPPVMFQASPAACVDDIVCGSFPVPSPLPDFNGDGRVNLGDYAVWRDQQGAVVSSLSGADADGDGIVGQGDYDLWKSEFGQVVPTFVGSGMSTQVAVSEPATASILSLAVVLLVWRGRNARQAK